MDFVIWNMDFLGCEHCPTKCGNPTRATGTIGIVIYSLTASQRMLVPAGFGHVESTAVAGLVPLFSWRNTFYNL